MEIKVIALKIAGEIWHYGLIFLSLFGLMSFIEDFIHTIFDSSNDYYVKTSTWMAAFYVLCWTLLARQYNL